MNAIVQYEELGAFSPAIVTKQVQLIQHVMRDAMSEGTHYGKIPGTDKPTLLKAGAEKLSLTFRLSPTYEIKRTDLAGNHREYEILCTLTHVPSGKIFGQGVGTCSTMESKYRYRNIADYEITDDPIPKDAKERKKEYRAQGFGMKKIDGQWCWVHYKDTNRQENQDIADTYNTVLKMAKKRAHVDAVLTATAASDIFNQDLEEYTPSELVYVPEESTIEIIVPEEVKNEVHDKTLAYLEIGDAGKMNALWKQYGADEQVVLWRMFNSTQRAAIRKLTKGTSHAD